VIEIVRTPLAEGDCESWKAYSSTRTANSLKVVECFRRHIAEENRIQITQVYAKLKRRGTAQNINSSVFELALELSGFLIVKLGCVFFNSESGRQVGFVE